MASAWGSSWGVAWGSAWGSVAGPTPVSAATPKDELDLSTYDGLRATVADYLQRTDLTAQIPAFIQLAEAQIKRRLRRKTVRTSLVIVQESTGLPADCAEVRSLHLLTSSRYRDLPLDVGTPEQLAQTRAAYSGAGRPVRAAMIGGQLVVAPEPDSPYTADLVYFQQLSELSAANQTNDILQEAPDLYLFGALKEAAPFLEHDERIPVWSQKFDAGIEEMNVVREREETNASLRPVRLGRVF